MKKAPKKTAKKVAKKTTKKAATPAKKAAKKTAKKTAKKAVKKTAKKKASSAAAKKKPAKKTAKTAAKKSTARPAKKAAKKAAKKTAKKKKTTTTTAAKKTPAPATTPAESAMSAYGALPAQPRKASAKVSIPKLQARDADDDGDGDDATGDGAAHDVVALPPRKKPLSVEGYTSSPRSGQAAVTLVPDGDDDDGDGDGDDDDDVEVEDTLARNLGAAFDGVFGRTTSTETPAERSRRLAVPFVPGDPTEDLAQACAVLAIDKKADDIVILKVADLTSYADYFVIAAAPSERQVIAIARNVADELKKRGKIALSTDGMDQGNWVIVDYGSVVLHVFLQSARSYYDLDGFWVDAPRIPVDEGRGQGALQAL